MRRKWLSGFIAFTVFFQLVSQMLSIPALAAGEHKFTGALGLSFAMDEKELAVNQSVDAVLGKDTVIDVTVSNNDATQWAYNVGIELALPDGMKVSDHNAVKPSSITSNSVEVQKAYWRDLKDLAPGESYTFPVTLQALENYRYLDGKGSVPFGIQPNVNVGVYASNDARQLYEPAQAANASALVKYRIVPFTVKIEDARKYVKGAGPDAAPPGSGDEYGYFNWTITIDNNTRAASNFSNFRNEVDGSLETYSYDHAPTSENFTAGKRNAVWTGLSVGAGATEIIRFKAAFLENTPAGTLLADGTTVTSSIIYSAIVEGFSLSGSTEYTAMAKDVIIHKTVDVTHASYGDTLTYNLKVVANEYYDITDVLITDIIGDGQQFSGYIGTAGTPASPTRSPDGTTVLTWDVGTIAKGTSVSFGYTTVVESSWDTSYSNGPVYAGDNLVNNVELTGKTVGKSGDVSDRDETQVKVNTPNISERIVQINGTTGLNLDEANVTVGDTITFEVNYDATGVSADQHNVVVYNFLPLGTLPDFDGDGDVDTADLEEFKLGGITPIYNADKLLLIWELGELDDSTTTLTANVKAVVQDSSTYVAADKGAENLVNLSYRNSPQQIESNRASVQLNFVEPELVIERWVDTTPVPVDVNPPVTVVSGQEVTITVKLTNNGESDAYNVSFKDTLPSELTNFNLISGANCSIVGSEIRCTPATPIAAGGSYTVVYKANVIDPIGAARGIKEGSKVTYDGQPTTTGVYRDYETVEDSHTTMRVPRASITKTWIDSATGNQNDVRIGDWVVYKIDVTIPADVVAYNSEIIDTIPTNQSLLTAFSAYNTGTNTGTELIPGTGVGQYNHTSPTVSIAFPATATGGTTYTYYVKTLVNQITSGNEELQQSKASYKWLDHSVSGAVRSIDSGNAAVTVKKPNLTSVVKQTSSVPDTPAAVTMGKDDITALTYKIVNNGLNAAFDFTPTVTLRPGFEFVDAGGNPDAAGVTGDINAGYTKTYAKLDLNGGGTSQSYNFHVRLVDLKGSGSSHPVIGRTGTYYATHDAYTKDDDGIAGNDPTAFEKFTEHQAQGIIATPAVTLTNAITATSNGSSLTQIRPGDTLDYKLTLTVPEGTQAYNVTVSDLFEAPSNFEIIGYTVDPVSIAVPDSSNWNAGLFTYTLGDVDASGGEKEFAITFHMRAKSDADKPALGDYSTTAKAQWSINDSDPTLTQTTANQPTEIEVIEPSVSIAPNPIIDSVFSDTNDMIPVSFTLTNAGDSAAYATKVELPIPTGLEIVNTVAHPISDSGTITAGKIIWTGLTIPAGGTEVITFYAKPGTFGAKTADIELIATLLRFQSTPVDQPGQDTTVFEPNMPAEQHLSIAAVELQHVLTATTNVVLDSVRPGDELTYELTVDIPGDSPAYNVILNNSGLTEQTIQSVTVNGAPITADGNGDYPLGNVAADTVVTVVTRTVTNTSISQNPYATSFKPTITYASAAADSSSHQATTSAITTDVIQPNLSILLNSDATEFAAVGDTITLSVVVDNVYGLSTAYNSVVKIKVPDGISIQSVGNSGNPSDTVASDDQNVTWTIAPIGAAGSRVITFTVTADNETAVGAAFDIEASIIQYNSLPDGTGKSYGPVTTNEIGVVVLGSHVLTGHEAVSLTAGQSKPFAHTLKNTGAGSDEFIITVSSPFPADLYAGNSKIASGSRIDGVWVWNSIASGYGNNGNVIIPAHAGGVQPLTLDVHVPETTPYDNSAAHVITMTATAVHTARVSSVQDELTVTGIPLDGWSGHQELAGWIIPVYGHGDGAKLQAFTAVNAAAVTAYYVDGEINKEIQLQVANSSSYINDGYKRWSGITILPDNIAPGSKTVTFVAYSHIGDRLETDAPEGLVGGNNPFVVQADLNVDGHITDSVTNSPMAGVTVTLYDPLNNVVVATTTADGNGYYKFTDVAVNDYEIRVQAVGYADAAVAFYALADNGASTTITVDVMLSPFYITLEAIPSSLLGDGNARTNLITTIKDKDGNPVANAPVTFASPQNRGSFPDGVNATTDANGRASVPFQSEAITGVDSVRFPVVVTVNDPARGLKATDQIIITFDPGAVTGIVTEMVNGVSVPVSGAIIRITKDFDNDGKLDFSATAVTGADGKYLIAVPRGNSVYDLTVTKPIKIGNETQLISFPQTATVGVVSAAGYELFPSNEAVSGVLLSGSTERGTSQFGSAIYNKMIGYLLDENGNVVKDGTGSRLQFPINSNGSFTAQNLPDGKYKLVIAYVFDSNHEIIVNQNAQGGYPPLEISSNGEMNITSELIDPYGTVTDAVTGLPIEGAHVQLYYANTPRNIAHPDGHTPGTLVMLPILVGFAPNDNINPQDTDNKGDYAYMVYSETDYYLVVTKPGYYTYTSPMISVEFAIVRHDLQMQPVPAPGPGTPVTPVTPVAPPADTAEANLAVELYTDRPSYPEGATITYTIEYLNRTNAAVKGAFIEAQIPANTVIEDAMGGKVTGNVIRFELGDLAPSAAGTLTYKVRASTELAEAEVLADNTATIGAVTKLVELADDRSSIQVMLFSSRFGEQKHERYTKGYPNGNWLPNRSITRAEIAAIFARIMNLEDTVKGTSFYSDIKPGFWAAEYIEAVSRAGLFSGYANNAFKPDQPITRAELSAVIFRYLKLQESTPIKTHFKDTNGTWAGNMIESIYRHHIITGYKDGTFKPNALMIRTEAVTMINRLLHRGPLANVQQSFPDMPKTHWAFGHVQESAVTHQFSRNADGSETMTKYIPEQLW
ncbi:hypothetical protein PAECIP111893_00885 [Paenibacillus plantiphilus]|uniref:DUF11 domain-containing protein n=1 Tax=Paenibacillus plantiphilus TaxID=2905650 RepID=A0ABN8G369_9BACL|nr:S-layer homology domain-containing protein [Paenibacillus plantiphilus]CAH1197690.1 hypothetical protein PAECIP111893_00885 [Paenibacillus plantiphilus]